MSSPFTSSQNEGHVEEVSQRQSSIPIKMEFPANDPLPAPKDDSPVILDSKLLSNSFDQSKLSRGTVLLLWDY